LLVVGEALVDVVVRPERDGVVPPVERHVGGSPANVAIGLARLGHTVTFATRVGDDPDGALVRAALQEDRVQLAPGWASRSRTSTATATLDATGSARYVFDLVWDLPPLDVSGADHLHTGSIGAALEPGSAAVQVAVHAAHTAGVTTSFDPNLRPQIMGSADAVRVGVEALVSGSDIVKASEEDLEWLYPGSSVQQVGARWAAAGPALVVVTRGGDGASAWRSADPSSAIAVAPQRVQVVDTVGAGDSFMSGLLSGLADAGLLGRGRGPALRAAPVDVLLAALHRATVTSSITCGRAGSNPPQRSEIA
jgi:fructokinase